jgi:hypothetical protein
VKGKGNLVNKKKHVGATASKCFVLSEAARVMSLQHVRW